MKNFVGFTSICLGFWLSSIPNPTNGQGVVVSVDTAKNVKPAPPNLPPPLHDTTQPDDDNSTTESPATGDIPVSTPVPGEISELQGNKGGGFRPGRGRLADPFKCRVEDEECPFRFSRLCCSGNCDSGKCKCRPTGSSCDEDFPGHCCSKTCEDNTCCFDEGSNCEENDDCCGKLRCRGRRQKTCRKTGGKNDNDD